MPVPHQDTAPCDMPPLLPWSLPPPATFPSLGSGLLLKIYLRREKLSNTLCSGIEFPSTWRTSSPLEPRALQTGSARRASSGQRRDGARPAAGGRDVARRRLGSQALRGPAPHRGVRGAEPGKPLSFPRGQQAKSRSLPSPRGRNLFSERKRSPGRLPDAAPLVHRVGLHTDLSSLQMSFPVAIVGGESPHT